MAATVKEGQAVKSLSTGLGRCNRRRFVFKSVAERTEEVYVDVFHSLDTLKSEPSSDSYFLDAIHHWRELNTAKDFMIFHMEILPIVTNLPLVILLKDMIITSLLSRLHMKAHHSLEPILRLTSELSRDLQTHFLPFLPRVSESYFGLLKSGADREPEIVEQIFTSWSYIMMYLQKHLTKNVTSILNKDTLRLRYYPEDSVQELMAEALSLLLRNAPDKQRTKGIKKVLREVAKKPTKARKSGVSALLWHIMRGTASKFHSRAEWVLRLLIDLSIDDKFTEGSGIATEVLIAACERCCMVFNKDELKLMWDCLCEKISNYIHGGSTSHLSRLLSVLISTITVERGRKVSDYKPVLELVRPLMNRFIIPSGAGEIEGQESDASDKILQLMLGILDGIYSTGYVDFIPNIALEWSPAFQLRCSSLLPFLKELLLKDYALLAFRSNIVSALSNMVELSVDEGVYLMLTFCEAMQAKTGSCNVLEGIEGKVVSKIRSFFQGALSDWIGVLENLKNEDSEVEEGRLCLLWGIVCCTPHLLSFEDSALLMNLVAVLDQLLITDDLAGISEETRQTLIGAVLNSYHKAGGNTKDEFEHTCYILRLANKYKSSRQVLSSVADYLDLVYGPTLDSINDPKTTHPELKAAKVIDALNIFSENLYNPVKDIRVSTLRILCHYELLACESVRSKLLLMEQHTNLCASEATNVDNVLKFLLTIEETPISIATSRKLTQLVSRIQTCMSTSRVSEAYVLPVFYGIIGILYNKFLDLSNSSLECISVMINTYPGLLWDCFFSFIEHCQAKFLNSHIPDVDAMAKSCSKANDLAERFHFSCSSALRNQSYSLILSVLLQALQKIPTIAESHFQQIALLFLKFLGYKDEYVSVGSFDSRVCGGMDWKFVLREWLNLLQMMKNPRSWDRSHLLKEVLVNRLLDVNDAEIQTEVLDCLLNWKDSFLLPYEIHLKNLINSKFLREELATWSLSVESNVIEAEHRAQLVPLIIRMLMPKVISLKTLAPRKHASVNSRKAVLGFITELKVDELPLFFALLMKSLRIAENGNDGTESWIWRSERNITNGFQPFGFLDHVTAEDILALPLKKRLGFLHVVEEIFAVFPTSHIRPFIDLLMDAVVRVLESSASNIYSGSNENSTKVEDAFPVEPLRRELDDQTQSHASASLAVKQLKDVRTFCLKIISLVLNKYEDHDFGSVFWDLFFKSVKPLICGFKQEGSSSEKPSSLFYCFLAMSKSQNLVPLLCREKNLIPDIFSILSTASEATVSGVLKFIENLLNLELELAIEKNAVREILLSNLEDLVDSLHHLFHPNPEKKKKRKRMVLNHPEETLLRVFKLLAKHIKNQSEAEKIVDILLPVACKGIKNSDVCAEALQILKEVIPQLGCESAPKILNAISYQKKIFDAISSILVSALGNARLAVCDVFDSLANIDSSMCSMAKLIRELNATSAVEMNALDFDTIINAYDQINMDYFKGIREDQAIVILSHCIYDMRSEDLTLRQRAYGSLISFIEFSSLVVGDKEIVWEEHIMSMSSVSWTADQIRTADQISCIVHKFFLKHMGEAMSKETTMRKGWIDLLHKMVEKLSGISSLKTLKSLCNTDAEVDFFDNIAHLQIHRRAKALSRFSKIAVTAQLSEFMLKTVFIPLFFGILFDLQTVKAEHVKKSCIDSLAFIAGKLGWETYYDLLMRCFTELAKRPDRENVVLRLICFILDKFHFSETSSEAANSNRSSEIQSKLSVFVLPKLQKMLVTDSERVNVNISLAMLKVLKMLPSDTMESQLSSIIYRISKFLKNRLESVRDEARNALAACLKEIGFEYLQLIVRAMVGILKRGFEVHVLGYTLHFILSKCLLQKSECLLPKSECLLQKSNCLLHSAGGKIDYCLGELLSIIHNDIFGEVSEQKDVEKIASKMKETRKQMSFDTLKLIAQNVTFASLKQLLSPVTAHLHKQLTPKVKLKLETMLIHIAEGIEKNPSVDQTELFVFVYNNIHNWLVEEDCKGKISSVVVSTRVNLSETSPEMAGRSCIENKPLFSHLIPVFALGLLHNRLRKMQLSKNNGDLINKLDPFIQLLSSCLSSKYEEVSSIAIKCVLPMIGLPLPSLELHADKIKEKLLDIAQSSFNADSPVTQSCLKLLTALLGKTKVTLSTDQLHVLVQFPFFIDLERNPSVVALTLLKAIARRKLIVPEIYDIVIQVEKLMITSQEHTIRKKCSEILLQFLLNYQLTEKCIQEHLDFLADNLRYEHATGREAVLEMLDTIIERFPNNIINDQSQMLFVRMVLALANDHDSHVRSLIGKVIKHLISRISPHSRHTILEYCIVWYLGAEPKLWSPSAQVIGFVVEVMKNGFHKHIDTILPMMKKHITHWFAVSVLNNMPTKSLDEEIIPFWKEAYYSLVLFEKIVTQFSDFYFAENVQDIWEAISEHLMHPHPWICNISSRLVALYFEKMEEQGFKLGTTNLTSISRLFLIAASSSRAVKVPQPEKVARVVKKNLVYAICGMQSLLRHNDPHTFWSSLDGNEQACFLRACRLLEPKEGKGIETSFTYGLNIDREENDASGVLVSGLLKALGKTALLTEDIQAMTILDCLQQTAMQMGKEDCEQHAIQFLLPIYKLCGGFSGKVVSDDVKQRAEEVRQRMEETLGHQKFGQAYGQIRQHLGERRHKRKREEKLMAVNDPVQNAKRKLRVSAKHKANKKRKITAMKFGRHWVR